MFTKVKNLVPSELAPIYRLEEHRTLLETKNKKCRKHNYLSLLVLGRGSMSEVEEEEEESLSCWLWILEEEGGGSCIS